MRVALVALVALWVGGGLAHAQSPDGGVDAGPPPDAGAPAPDAGAPSPAPSAEDESDEPPDEAPADAESEAPEPPEEPSDAPAPEEPFDDGFDDAAMEAELAALDGEEAGEGDRGEAREDPEPAGDAIEFDEMVVAYTPEDVFRRAGSGTVIDEAQLERMSYDDPHATLRQATGVYVRTEDGFGLRPNIGMRGVNPERSKKITLLEDGVLFGPAPYSAPAAYYFPLMARMVGVEVLKGPAALIHGPQTVAGSIDLRTRPIPSDSEGGADVAFGRFRTRRLHLHYGSSNRWGGFLFEALDVASAGFKTIDESNRDTGFQRTDFMLRGFVHTDPSDSVYHRLSLKLGFGRERSNETYLGLTDADFEADPYRRYAASANDRMAWWRTQVVLTHRLEVGERFEMVTDVYRHDFDRSWNRVNGFVGARDLRGVLLRPESFGSQRYYGLLAGDLDADPSDPDDALRIIDNQRRYVSQGIQTRARYRHLGRRTVRHTIEVGARFHHDGVERDQREEGFFLVGGALVPDELPEIPVTRDLRETLATSLYAVYAMEWKWLTLTPGVRTEIIHSRYENALAAGSLQVGSVTRAALLPGMGAEVEVATHTAVFAGVHRGFSPASPGQPEGVEPETSVGYELGGRFIDKGEGRHLEVVGFLNDYSNLLTECSFSASCAAEMTGVQFNAGEVLVWGAEMTAAWAFELGRDFEMPARLVYTYTDSSFGSTFNSGDPTLGGLDGLVVEGDEVPYLPKHTAQLQLGVQHRLFGVHLVGTYVGESREEAGQGPIPEALRTERVFLLDASVEAHPHEAVRVYARFDNLLNQAPIVSRRPFGARTIKPLGVLVGVEATF